jgi:hypothetical protein
MIAASSSLREFRISRNAKSTCERRLSDVSPHAAAAARATPTTSSTSSADASGTRRTAVPSAGSCTSPVRPDRPARSLPPTQWAIFPVVTASSPCPDAG